MNKRQQMSESRGYSGQSSRLLDGVKKYGVVGGGILAVIMAALFVLAFQVALIISGVMLVAAAVIAAYIYFVKKL
jgi:asparagine N-glycosylation enzyme membrane subunit Stt3